MAKKVLKSIKIHMVHGSDGSGEGFMLDHEHGTPGKITGYDDQSELSGSHVMSSHGEVMHHIHKYISGHGDGEQQNELSGGKREADDEEGEEETACPLCSDPHHVDEEGEKELRASDLPNLKGHGYKKGSSADPHTGGHSAKHPGFKAVQSKIASKEHLSSKAAGAILASRTRGASHAAHKANPRLNRVKG